MPVSLFFKEEKLAQINYVLQKFSFAIDIFPALLIKYRKSVEELVFL
jgi:hypothetical protein